MFDVLAIGIFTDDGKAYLIGKDKKSAVKCVGSGVVGMYKDNGFMYIDNIETQLAYLSRAVDVISKR